MQRGTIDIVSWSNAHAAATATAVRPWELKRRRARTMHCHMGMSKGVTAARHRSLPAHARLQHGVTRPHRIDGGNVYPFARRCAPQRPAGRRACGCRDCCDVSVSAAPVGQRSIVCAFRHDRRRVPSLRQVSSMHAGTCIHNPHRRSLLSNARRSFTSVHLFCSHPIRCRCCATLRPLLYNTVTRVRQCCTAVMQPAAAPA